MTLFRQTLGENCPKWNLSKRRIASQTSQGRWSKVLMKNQMLTWSRRADKSMLPTKSGSLTNNWLSKRRLRRHLLSPLERECAPTQPQPIDICLLDSTIDKWLKTSSPKLQLTETPHMVPHSKNPVMPPLSLKSRQNFKSLKILKRLRKRTIQILLTKEKEDLVRTIDANFPLDTILPKMSQIPRSHQSNWFYPTLQLQGNFKFLTRQLSQTLTWTTRMKNKDA